MKRRRAILTMVAMICAPARVWGQTPGKLPRVVVIHAGASSEPPSMQRVPFERSLRENGWTPGSTVLIEYRYAEGSVERLAELARELAHSDAKVIVARGPAVVRAVHAAVVGVPVVMLYSDDPVADGLVKSLGRPGSNMTGLNSNNFALDIKRLELVKETFPRVMRVAILTNPKFDGSRLDERAALIHARARALKVQTQIFAASTVDEIAAAFDGIVKFKAQALLVRPDPQVIDRARGQIIELAAKHRLPAVYPWRFFVESGGLLSYSTDFVWLHSQSGIYVSRILKGEKPAQMPIEQPAKYEMAVNLGTARALGIEIPKAVLFRADVLVQ